MVGGCWLLSTEIPSSFRPQSLIIDVPATNKRRPLSSKEQTSGLKESIA